MESHARKIFLNEINRQCDFVIHSAMNINESLQKNEVDALWYHIQAFLVAAGNISKLLWPPNKSFADRGEQLRQFLSIENDSPLAVRTFRNHFEHYDERLEDWARSSKRENYVDSNVGPTRFIAGIDPEDYLRNYDTSDNAITFRGDKYLLQPVFDSVVQIKNKINQCGI